MRTIFTIARKDLTHIWRDKFAMFWIIGFPVAFALFFGTVFSSSSGGGAGTMTIAVVDLDDSEASAEFVADIDAHDSIRLATLRAEGEPIEWTVDRALEAVRKGDIVAYVAIPDGFGDSNWNHFDPNAPALEVGIDPSRSVERGYLEGALMQVAGKRMERMFTSIIDDPSSVLPDIDDAAADVAASDDISAAQKLVFSGFFFALEQFMRTVDLGALGDAGGPGGFEPVQIEERDVVEERDGPPSAFAFTMPQAIAWAIMSCTAGFSISIVTERTKGTFLRLHVAPHTRRSILAGKGLACFLGCASVTVLLLLFARLALGVRMDNVPHVLLAIGATAFCFTGITMFVSTLGRTEQGVAGAGWALLMPLAMIGGAMIPLMVMPSWMRTISSVSPIKWTIVAFEGAIWRGFSTTEMLPALALLLAFGVTGLGAGVYSLSRQRII